MKDAKNQAQVYGSWYDLDSSHEGAGSRFHSDARFIVKLWAAVAYMKCSAKYLGFFCSLLFFHIVCAGCVLLCHGQMHAI